MLRVDRRFTDLDTIVDDLHDLFEWWSQEALDAGALDEDGVEVMKLAVHEWLANLVQHARFPADEPLVKLSIAPDKDRIRCIVEDNSHGFDLLRQVTHQQHHLQGAPEPPERGRGLLLMIACTENLSYRPVPAPRRRKEAGNVSHRLEFWVSPRYTIVSTPFDEPEAFDAPLHGRQPGARADRPLVAAERA